MFAGAKVIFFSRTVYFSRVHYIFIYMGKRRDLNRILYAGGLLKGLYGSDALTATTEVEDYGADFTLTVGDRTHYIEVKTLKQRYYHDPRYITGYTPDEFMVINTGGDKSKWQKFVDGVLDGLMVITREKTYIFNLEDLFKADAGVIDMKCRHTKEMGNREWRVEQKHAIDLTKATKIIEDKAPEELFA